MATNIKRVFVEKKKEFDVEAQALFADLKDNLGVYGLKSVRIVYRYDIEGISDDEYRASLGTILSEPPVDIVWHESFDTGNDRVIAVEYLPGQYDRKADVISQCIQMMTMGNRPECRAAKLIILKGDISDSEFSRIKNYCVNPVECRIAGLDKPGSLYEKPVVPGDVEAINGFTGMSKERLKVLTNEMGLAMSIEDMEFCRKYFKDTEKRDPTITEIRMLDTYWSDHCRHTTFLTKLENVEFEKGQHTCAIKSVYEEYIKSREYVYESKKKDICLMDIATIAMKELKKKGRLPDLDESDEINACSIKVNVNVNGKDEDWLVMFKNETHNHPTEIEPFGGAATCLGGAIRDPLSGRSYVYQAMRVTGSGNPSVRVQDTIPGKLPQRKITTTAAEGYSSYGNQIGVPAGHVSEIYNEGYVAKRMELGAVIAAAPAENVVRMKPQPGDIVILLGGRTGRDGCGGATGSSKAHTEESLITSGAEVQKGNPALERRILRLFRKPSASRMIKKCNDFGAGGVSVAVGELADGLDINLDLVPVKYEGLDGTELAISESQERMAVVVSKEDVNSFVAQAREENLEATPIAVVASEKRVRITWRGKTIVDISREFLDSNGVKQYTNVYVKAPDDNVDFFNTLPDEIEKRFENIEDAWFWNLQRLDVCSQKGLVGRFDSTAGAGTVLMPFGGKYQLSPAEGMAAKIPVLDGDTTAGTLMAYGYSPSISEWSPFHSAVYAVVEAVAKVTAMGGDYKSVRLSLQEYFEKLGKDPVKWGKPFSALLGAYHAQMKLGIPAIGGKDSMSGTFEDLNVPPTLVAFAVGMVNVSNVVSTEFKKTGSSVVLVPVKRDENGLPDFDKLTESYSKINELIKNKKVLAASTIKIGGLAETVTKMCFGNMTGFGFSERSKFKDLFSPHYGSIVLEIPEGEDLSKLFDEIEYKMIGRTIKERVIAVNGKKIELETALEKWEEPLEKVFPVKTGDIPDKPVLYHYDKARPSYVKTSSQKPGLAGPRVLIPVFPGTNGEYETAEAFRRAGGTPDILVMKNLSPGDIQESVILMAQKIDNSQAIAFPGGSSTGREPGGSGKFIAAILRNPRIEDAIIRLLKQRDGLILGIGSGFQALLKAGLLPWGEFKDMNDKSPTLTLNTIGRHVSSMVMTRVVSNLSPWLHNVKVGDIHTLAVSHLEGRFEAGREDLVDMGAGGQIATQYVDFDGKPTYDIRFNPNGSIDAIEGITSPDGRIFGKMGHPERAGTNVAKNVPGNKEQKIFEAGMAYFSL